MRIITAIEVASNAPERWRDQYAHWNDDDRFADGTTKREKSKALNMGPPTPEHVSHVLNEGWAYPECHSCGKYVDVVICISDPAWGDHHPELCEDCLDRAAFLVKSFKEPKK